MRLVEQGIVHSGHSCIAIVHASRCKSFRAQKLRRGEGAVHVSSRRRPAHSRQPPPRALAPARRRRCRNAHSCRPPPRSACPARCRPPLRRCCRTPRTTCRSQRCGGRPVRTSAATPAACPAGQRQRRRLWARTRVLIWSTGCQQARQAGGGPQRTQGLPNMRPSCPDPGMHRPVSSIPRGAHLVLERLAVVLAQRLDCARHLEQAVGDGEELSVAQQATQLGVVHLHPTARHAGMGPSVGGGSRRCTPSRARAVRSRRRQQEAAGSRRPDGAGVP